jgi:hypothetical protein
MNAAAVLDLMEEVIFFGRFLLHRYAAHLIPPVSIVSVQWQRDAWCAVDRAH